MVLGRKFKIWLISFALIMIVFLLYRLTSNTEVIEVTRLEYDTAQTDSNGLADSNSAGQIGQAKLEYLERARFETVDAKTRKLKRVIGFEKVLHKTGDQWVLDKPYMNVFQDKLRCNIIADTGIVEIENVEGANPAPKSAVLQKNVIIHIIPESAGQSESFIYLDEVTFDSDRSMFFSHEDVNFVSADAHLVGRGLEVVYNSISSRLEYLKVQKINYLDIMRLEEITKEPKTAQSPAKQTAAVQKPAQQKQPDVNKTAEPVKTAAADNQSPVENNKESYKCFFRDNVSLEYQNSEVVLADEIAIVNLMMGSSDTTAEPKTAAAKQQQPVEITSETTAEQNEAPKIVDSQTEPQKTIVEPKSFEPKPVVATLRCDGPMIVRPDSFNRRDDYKYAKFKAYEQLPQSLRKKLGKRNVLLSQRVSYDYTEKIAKAHGQTELVFYAQSQQPKQKPYTISSKKGADFITEQNKINFYGNVKGALTKKTPDYDEENVFYGDKLTVDLISEDTDDTKTVSAEVAHVAVTGPVVRLESIRTTGDTKLSHVRLKSKRIDYDKITEDVIANGKGQIQYAKEAAGAGADEKLCYAIIDGFDRLTWDTDAMAVTALSEKTSGIHVGYVPFEKNDKNQKEYGNKITIDTRRVDVNYFEPVKGRAQIKELLATGGVVFYEEQKYEFAGRQLRYNSANDLIVVSSSEDMPCMLNGVFAEAIEYNIATGAAKAVGKSVGVLPVRE